MRCLVLRCGLVKGNVRDGLPTEECPARESGGNAGSRGPAALPGSSGPPAGLWPGSVREDPCLWPCALPFPGKRASRANIPPQIKLLLSGDGTWIISLWFGGVGRYVLNDWGHVDFPIKREGIYDQTWTWFCWLFVRAVTCVWERLAKLQMCCRDEGKEKKVVLAGDVKNSSFQEKTPKD